MFITKVPNRSRTVGGIVWLGLLFFMASSALLAGDLDNHDRVLLTWRGKPYTVGDVTLMPYGQAIESIRRMHEEMLQGGSPPYSQINFRLVPAARHYEWDGYSDAGEPREAASCDIDTLISYYHYLLDGIVYLFTRNQIYLELRDKFPLSDPPEFDFEDLLNRVKTRSLLNQKVGDAVRRGRREGMSYDEYVEMALGEGVPEDRIINSETFLSPSTFLSGKPWPFLRVHECLPFTVDGAVPPWEMWIGDYYIAFHVYAELRRNWHAEVDRYLAGHRVYRVFSVRNALEGDLPGLERLFKRISDEEGRLATRGLDTANEVFRLFGSPLRIVAVETNAAEFERFGLAPEDIPFLEFIKTTENEGLNNYAYIYQRGGTVPARALSEVINGYEIFTNFAARVVPPVVESVLADLEVAEGFTKPPLESFRVEFPSSLHREIIDEGGLEAVPTRGRGDSMDGVPE